MSSHTRRLFGRLNVVLNLSILLTACGGCAANLVAKETGIVVHPQIESFLRQS